MANASFVAETNGNGLVGIDQRRLEEAVSDEGTSRSLELGPTAAARGGVVEPLMPEPLHSTTKHVLVPRVRVPVLKLASASVEVIEILDGYFFL